MTDVQTDRDLKAGTSSMCRRDEHDFCKSAGARCSCSCHGAKGQEARRPSKEPPMPMSDRDVRGTPKAQPIFAERPKLTTVRETGWNIELVKSEPPLGRGGRPRFVDQIKDLVEDVRAEPGQWFRIATWPGKSSASGFMKLVKAAYPDLEWSARRFGEGSALFVRKAS